MGTPGHRNLESRLCDSRWHLASLGIPRELSGMTEIKAYGQSQASVGPGGRGAAGD